MENNDEIYCFGSIASRGKTPNLIKAIHEEERANNSRQGIERYRGKIRDWEYGYCLDCGQVRLSSELEATPEGIRCSKCQGYNLEAPGWTICPYFGETVIKCPRAGKSIINTAKGIECREHCHLRVPI